MLSIGLETKRSIAAIKKDEVKEIQYLEVDKEGLREYFKNSMNVFSVAFQTAVATKKFLMNKEETKSEAEMIDCQKLATSATISYDRTLSR